MKYVIVTGGVVSGLGKGITASSIGVLLKAAGLIVTCVKIDPYLNVDAGTMSPYEHGEVYVLDDGGEGDLDLGNYERFLDVRLSRDHNITTGKIYQHVITKERRGDYLGKTVQIVPHVTDAVQQWIERVALLPVEAHYTGPGCAASQSNYDESDSDKKSRVPDVCIVEVGGTVGDIESMIFLEALSQLRYQVGSDNFCHVHVSLVPMVTAVGEQKSKPTQHSVIHLRAVGLSADIIVCRSTEPANESIVTKISQFCRVPRSHIIPVPDVANSYQVPVVLMKQHVPELVLNVLKINRTPVKQLPSWENLAAKLEDPSLNLIHIALCGKYTELSDSYLSVGKALQHAALASDVRLKIDYVDSQALEHTQKQKGDAALKAYEDAWQTIKQAHGILVPGGFGERGVEGKILAVNYARLHGKPYLGICLGLQVAIIEYARNVLGISTATSGEFESNAENPVIVFMPEGSTTHMGGTMRLGARKTLVKEGTVASQLYAFQKFIFERHRHRYEVNPDYLARLQAAGRNEDGSLRADAGKGVGLLFSGTDDKQQRMECIELEEQAHPFFFGTQYHPEFLSRPLRPSPPFLGFIQAAAGKFVRSKLSYPSSSSSTSGSSCNSGSGTAASINHIDFPKAKEANGVSTP